MKTSGRRETGNLSGRREHKTLSKTRLCFKKPSFEEDSNESKINTNIEDSVGIVEADKENKYDLYKAHVEKMEKINQRAKLYPNTNNNLINKNGGNSTKFVDNFGQDLTVPCLPKKGQDGQFD